MTAILLTGANGVVGTPLSKYLRDECIEYRAISRSLVDNGFQWDLHESAAELVIDQVLDSKLDTLVHCAPIWLLPKHLADFKTAGIRRIIVFSSSSVSSKENSADSSEHNLVLQLSSSEQFIKEFCTEHGINVTLFRPSLIYGYQRDQNICHIANFINKFGFFVLVGKGKGLRQPVHADDLVSATMAVIDNPATFGKTYYLAGGEVLSYYSMVTKIFAGLNRKSRMVSLPLSLFRCGLKVAGIFGRFAYTPEMADRMNQNLNYDISAAQSDFDYSPQAFMTQPQRDLPVKYL